MEEFMETIRNEQLSTYFGINAGEYFLTMEKISLEMLADEMNADSVMPDFTLLSVSPVVKWMLGRIETLHQADRPYDDCEYSSHINGEIDNLILHASYYLGESFVRSVPSLRWETNTEGGEKNVFPVISGFKYGLKLCPVDDINNMYARIMTEKADRGVERYIDEVILQWLVRLK